MDIGKRILSLLLSAALIIACIPVIELPVYANDDTQPAAEVTVSSSESHEALPASPATDVPNIAASPSEDTPVSEGEPASEDTVTEEVPASEEVVTEEPAFEEGVSSEETVTEEEPASEEETCTDTSLSDEAIQESHTADTLLNLQHLQIPFQLNSRYQGCLDASDFSLPDPELPAVMTCSDFVSESTAAAQIREYMKTRTATFTVDFISDESDPQTAAHLVFDKALEHTGNPLEGDYLAWQFGGWNGSISYGTTNGQYIYSITYNVTYYTSAAQEAELNTAVSSLLASLDLSGNDYEDLCAVYDYMCDTITYDYDTLNDTSYKLKYSAYAALINKTAVCQGYANLLYRLALELGIDCRLISGIGNGGAHGWNIVALGNKYYNADATWDTNYSTYDNYQYFLRCDANFYDHTRDDEYATASFYAAYPMSETDYDPVSDPGTEDSQVLTQSQFQTALAAAQAAGQEYLLDKEVTLASNMEIPADSLLKITSPGRIIVPAGVQLSINGTVSLTDASEILVQNSGVLIVNGSLTVSENASLNLEIGGTLLVNGTLVLKSSNAHFTVASDASVLINGTVMAETGCSLDIAPITVLVNLHAPASVTGMDGLVYAISMPESGDELPALLEAGTGYVIHIMMPANSITLTEDTEIPANTIVDVTGEQTVITVPSGVSLTNLGNILLNDGTTLLVRSGATLIDRGFISGNVVMEGTLIYDAAFILGTILDNAEYMTPDEIRETVQGMNRDALADAMDSGNDSVGFLAALEDYVGGSVSIITDDSCGFTADQVSIIGANLNTPVSGSDITLIISARELSDPAEYGNICLMSLSMTLEGVADPHDLDVPVKMRLPVPDTAGADNLVLLHHLSDGSIEVIHPGVYTENGTTFIEFVLTGFSLFDLIGTVPSDSPAGDLNGDGAVNDADVEHLLWHTLFGNSFPITGDADFNNDGAVNDADVEYLLWHTLFGDAFPL